MAIVSVSTVTQNFPEVLNGDVSRGTVDMTVDGKYVRMTYEMSSMPDAVSVRGLLENDADILKLEEKQKDAPYPAPVYGIDRPDLVPANFPV